MTAKSIVPLDSIVYDSRARDGRWCASSYPGHPKGCPNFPTCPNARPDYMTLERRHWYAVMETFDLAKHAKRMKEAHPKWSEQRCRCVLYWQGGVRARLKMKVREFVEPGDLVLDIPEASGINVFSTMNEAGIHLEARHPNNIHKVMLVGKKKLAGSMKCPKCGSETKDRRICPDCHYILGTHNGYSWGGHEEKVK